MPGSMPATSQLDWLSSMTAMIVLFWSRATRDLLKSFGWGIAGTPSIRYSDEVAISRRPPHSIYRSLSQNEPSPLTPRIRCCVERVAGLLVGQQRPSSCRGAGNGNAPKFRGRFDVRTVATCRLGRLLLRHLR